MLASAAAMGGVSLFMGDGSSARTATLSARPIAGGGALSFERRF